MRVLPPLNALRAFEAAGRHLSISKAADELHVTPAAVSHQVKALEDWLGVQLFRRLNRALLLTEEGQILLVGLTDGFDHLARALEDVTAAQASGVLTVSTSPGFSSRWLAPRVGDFTAAHPDIDLRISATLELAHFERDGIDAAVRFGTGHYPGLSTWHLFHEALVPVCSPDLLEPPVSLRSPADLARTTLLHDDWRSDRGVTDWSMLLKMLGADTVDGRRGVRFNLGEDAIQAALGGAGVAVTTRMLVADELKAGRLVIPFPDAVMQVPMGYWFVCPERAAERPKVVAFRDWLLAQVAAESERTHAPSPDHDAAGRAKSL